MIKNIILDFGDVFINLDYAAIPKALRELGVAHLPAEWYPLFTAYEKGQLSSPDFLSQTGVYFPKVGQQALVKAWNAVFRDFPQERLTFLEALARENQYRLFLLSNTNELHINYIKQTLGREKFHRFTNAFEQCYLSYELGMRKPDTAIFEWVLTQNHLQPSETLFVDDQQENTDAAESLGINVWNLNVGQEDITQLKTYL